MIKRSILAIAVAFMAWSILDFSIHGVLLLPAYEAMPDLWRPLGEMKRPLMNLVMLLSIIFFVAIYTSLISRKSFTVGVKYGLLFGLASGISMGFGSYCYIPIPIELAFSWFAGYLIASIVAGAIVGLIVKPPKEVL